MRCALRRAAAVGTLALVAAGCRTSGLDFRRDDHLRLLTPREDAEVSLPLDVQLTPTTGGTWVLFVDRAPMGPGETLLSLVGGDDPCRTQRVCPDADWLARRQIHPFAADRYELSAITEREVPDGAPEGHVLTFVRLDEDGHREGELAIVRHVDVVREGAS